jgi:hypothetical protein
VRSAMLDGTRPGTGEPSVAGGRACRAREQAAGKGGSSEAECGHCGDSRMDAVTTTIQEESEQTLFFYFLAT